MNYHHIDTEHIRMLPKIGISNITISKRRINDNQNRSLGSIPNN
jgi:hypothetical protein